MRTQVLDHGYIEKIEHWGSDERIVESARMSTDKGFLGWDPGPCPVCHGCSHISPVGVPTCNACGGKGTIPGDAKLLKYLYEMKHSTPFEFGGLTIEVQAPIMTFREWFRHRVPFGYSELSARYSPMPNFNYIPTLERCMVVNATNKQAGKLKGSDELTPEKAQQWLAELERLYEECEQVYQHGLNVGIPKELARLIVPVGRYSRMRATGNLRGWLGFMTLRMAEGAQYEIRVFANEVANIIAKDFPRTYELFCVGRK